MSRERVYRGFRHCEAVFRICCERFDAVCAEIVRQRAILEEYIGRHGDFQRSLVPLGVLGDAPEVARRMSRGANVVGVGPMAAVAGAMAQLGAEAGLAAGADEAIVENGGDIFVISSESVIIGLYAGKGGLAGRLGFSVEADEMPIAICSSSGVMGHSMSFGSCDLCTVVAGDAALADAAATWGANLVSEVGDVDGALAQVEAIEGVMGVMIVKDDSVGLAGKLPDLVKLG